MTEPIPRTIYNFTHDGREHRLVDTGKAIILERQGTDAMGQEQWVTTSRVGDVQVPFHAARQLARLLGVSVDLTPF